MVPSQVEAVEECLVVVEVVLVVLSQAAVVAEFEGRTSVRSRPGVRLIDLDLLWIPESTLRNESCRRDTVVSFTAFSLSVFTFLLVSNVQIFPLSSSPVFGILRANAHVFENTHLGICHERRVPGGISLSQA